MRRLNEGRIQQRLLILAQDAFGFILQQSENVDKLLSRRQVLFRAARSALEGSCSDCSANGSEESPPASDGDMRPSRTMNSFFSSLPRA